MRQRTSALLFLALTGASAQQTFEVASIKLNASGDNRVFIGRQRGGRFTATGITLKTLISQAYNVRDFQITNTPGWISAERYDINAKAEGLGDRIPPEVLRPLLQSLLEERFGLKAHFEDKEGQVYNLVTAKSGPKMKVSEAAPLSPDGPGGSVRPGGPGHAVGGMAQGRQMIRMGRGEFNGSGVSMANLTQMLAQNVGRPVIDKTELKDTYDVEMKWTPEPGQGMGGPFSGGGPPPGVALPPVDPNGPTIFTALQEQLGLKLEAARGNVQMLVIDSVSKPTEN